MQQENLIHSLNIHDDAKRMLLHLMYENQRLQSKIDILEDKLISTEEACEVLGCGRKRFWTMAKSEYFPKATKFGKTNHYKLSEIIAIRDKIGLSH